MATQTVAVSSPEWRVANSTLCKLVGTVLLCGILVKLYPLILLFCLSLLLACTLYPAIRFFERYVPHWAASMIISALVGLGLIGLVLGVIPSLIDQFSLIAKKLPEMQEMVLKNVPEGSSERIARDLIQNPAVSPEHIVAVGQYLVGAISEVIVIVAVALFLAADGQRTYLWIRAFFSKRRREKIDETAQEASKIIVAYVSGQLLTSILCGIFVFIVLKVLHVPAALVLAVLAGVFDVLPMLGFFLFTVPAVLFALTVSPHVALTVLALYIAYHFIENYLIVPKVYGHRLRLSDLVVLSSVLAGAYLAGIAGAILILPMVAAYPALERIWLRPIVGDEVIEKHEAVENSAR